MEDEQSPACCFSAADILLPRDTDPAYWAVIACDQFTSQPEYWQAVRERTQGRVSAAHLILPESELNRDPSASVERIHRTMLQYLQDGVFQSYRECYIYTERTLLDGSIRCGVVGKVDLEAYDYSGTVNAAIRATEKTVPERIPPRMAVRRGAALELPHVLLLCDDDQNLLLEPLHRNREVLPKLYDFDLMLGGGHVAGWLVSGKEKQSLDARLLQYAEDQAEKHPDSSLLFAVGDGNHSLATAKACYEEQKALHSPAGTVSAPTRYALCELNNIHDPAQKFTPIHRLVKHCNVREFLADLQNQFPYSRGTAVPWMTEDASGTVFLPCESDSLPLTILQDFLDRWLSGHPGELDYIHGEDVLMRLSRNADSVGFLLPAVEKNSLFSGILADGVLPRKTFSMGQAEEKRYYLEARNIQ